MEYPLSFITIAQFSKTTSMKRPSILKTVASSIHFCLFPILYKYLSNTSFPQLLGYGVCTRYYQSFQAYKQDRTIIFSVSEVKKIKGCLRVTKKGLKLL